MERQQYIKNLNLNTIVSKFENTKHEKSLKEKDFWYKVKDNPFLIFSEGFQKKYNCFDSNSNDLVLMAVNEKENFLKRSTFNKLMSLFIEDECSVFFKSKINKFLFDIYILVFKLIFGVLLFFSVALFIPAFVIGIMVLINANFLEYFNTFVYGFIAFFISLISFTSINLGLRYLFLSKLEKHYLIKLDEIIDENKKEILNKYKLELNNGISSYEILSDFKSEVSALKDGDLKNMLLINLERKANFNDMKKFISVFAETQIMKGKTNVK